MSWAPFRIFSTRKDQTQLRKPDNGVWTVVVKFTSQAYISYRYAYLAGVPLVGVHVVNDTSPVELARRSFPPSQPVLQLNRVIKWCRLTIVMKRRLKEPLNSLQTSL